MDARLAVSFILSSLLVIAGSWPLEPLAKDAQHQQGKDALLFDLCLHCVSKTAFLG